MPAVTLEAPLSALRLNTIVPQVDGSISAWRWIAIALCLVIPTIGWALLARQVGRFAKLYQLGEPDHSRTNEPGTRTLTLALSRFCWECGGTRVMAAMQFGDVTAVKSRRLPRLPETPLELLAMDFEPAEAPGGRVILMFAGGGDLRIDVECLDAVLTDLSERWPARMAPTHLDEEAAGA